MSNEETHPIIGADGELVEVEKIKNQPSSIDDYWRTANVFLLNPQHLELVLNKDLPRDKKKREKSFPIVWIPVLLIALLAYFVVTSYWFGILIVIPLFAMVLEVYVWSMQKTWQIKYMLWWGAQLTRGHISARLPADAKHPERIRYTFKTQEGLAQTGCISAFVPLSYSVTRTYKRRIRSKEVQPGTNVAVLYVNDKWHTIL